MLGCWRIARIFGIDLFIHWTFWLLPVWVLFARDAENAIMPLWLEFLTIGSLFFCVVLHEFGHALTARRFGIGTRSITLSPLGGIAQLDHMSHKPWEEFCIAIAGPLVNVSIAGVLGLGVLGAYVLEPGVVNTLWWRFMAALLSLNVMLVVFNMLPAFPMDGGRVLRAILASSMGLVQGTRVAVTVGTVVAILMGAAGLLVFGNPWIFLIAAFVILAGQQELRALEAEDRQRREALRLTIPWWDSRRGMWVRRDLTERVEHTD